MSSDSPLNAMPEDADGHRRQVEALLHARDEVQRQALVDHHARVPEREVVVVERRELHRVLEQARPGREPGPGHVGRTRVVVRERGADALEVEAEVVGDHVELVGGRELDVAPRVREQLGELGFLDVEVDDRVGEAPEQRLGPGDRPLGAAGDDLRELEQLDQRLALGDALRTERDVDGLARLAARLRSTIAVTPGYTVLRRIRI